MKWKVRALLCAFGLVCMMSLQGFAQQNVTAEICFDGDRVTYSGSGVQTEGTLVSITQPGTYRVAGEAQEGSILVYAGKSAQVELILSGVSLHSAERPVIAAEKTGSLILLLEDGTQNRLICGDQKQESAQHKDEDSESVHCVHAKGDLIVRGGGALSVYGYLGGGMRASQDVVIDGGTIQIDSLKDGIKGKDSVQINGGSISIRSDADGIQSENADGGGSGYVVIRGGTIDVISTEDGIQSETTLDILGGEVRVNSGGGSTDDRKTGGLTDDMPPEFPHGTDADNMPSEFPLGMNEGHRPPEPPDGFVPGGMQSHGNGRMGREMRPEAEKTDGADDADASSAKGIKSGAGMIIDGGSVYADARDDALHAGGKIVISGGSVILLSNDDGIHADGNAEITGGYVDVQTSYEALEAQSILIAGGEIRLRADDDGVNAGSGLGMLGWSRRREETGSSELLPSLRITGGSLTIDADGDGLDSNGDLIVEGGMVIVNGPENGGNGALDSGAESGGRCMITGGTVLAVGSSAMAEAFDAGSAQGAILYRAGHTFDAGTKLTILAQDESILVEHTLIKAASSVVFSCPALADGDVVEIAAGDIRDSVTVGENAAGFSDYDGGRGRRRGRRLAP